MEYIIEYDELGRITYTGDLQKGEEEELKKNKIKYIKSNALPNTGKNCVIGGEVRKKGKLNTHHVINNGVVTFNAIPEGTTVIVGKNLQVLTSQGIEMEFNEVGTYVIEFIESPCHLDAKVEVTIG